MIRSATKFRPELDYNDAQRLQAVCEWERDRPVSMTQAVRMAIQEKLARAPQEDDR